MRILAFVKVAIVSSVAAGAAVEVPALADATAFQDTITCAADWTCIDRADR